MFRRQSTHLDGRPHRWKCENYSDLKIAHWLIFEDGEEIDVRTHESYGDAVTTSQDVLPESGGLALANGTFQNRGCQGVWQHSFRIME